MARLSIFSDRVRSLVDQKLAPLFLAEQSTAGLCKSLNRILPDNATTATIHPNRIHALLSDDISRGVNEATLELVEKAVDALQAADKGWQDRSGKRLEQLKSEADLLRQTSGLDDEGIEQRLGIPPAVVRHVFSKDAAETIKTPIKLGITQIQKGKVPDWSFQDVAISRTLEAFRQRPSSKVGLILPTGAGKTRTALRIVLEKLAQAPASETLVYWVTHRKNLRTQAHRELQKLLSTGKDQVPENAASMLAKRIIFVMVGELPKILAHDAQPPLLIVVDEAHHAAAPSYQSIFEASYPVPALFLTATPNRTDSLPIGIDEIAFTISYRELEERGVVIMPEFLDFPVNDFEWLPEQVADLANYVIDEASDCFTKILVLAPRIDRVEEFYDALLKAHSEDTDHPLDAEDIGYVHGTGNSLHIDNDDFLSLFAEKPRAILVSAQLLLEGFDDPGINTVVLTYPSSSVVRLMQASGRCVRYAPGKSAAYVVQARNDALAYHFEQRWLYQEISDHLRPQLTDIDYSSEVDLRVKVSKLLDQHHVKSVNRARILDLLDDVKPGKLCRLLFHGFPYYGDVDQFEEHANWGAFLETQENSMGFRGVFNAFCALGANLSDPSDFLTRDGARFGIAKDLSPGSPWRALMLVLTSSYFACEEIYGSDPLAKASRPSKRHDSTTWLRYVTFHFRPDLPHELSEFLADCYNNSDLIAAYLDDPVKYALAIKLPLPLGGHEGWLLTADSATAFEACIKALREQLNQVKAADQFGLLASFLAGADYPHLPSRVLLRIEAFLGDEPYDARLLRLPSYQSSKTQGD